MINFANIKTYVDCYPHGCQQMDVDPLHAEIIPYERMEIYPVSTNNVKDIYIISMFSTNNGISELHSKLPKNLFINVIHIPEYLVEKHSIKNGISKECMRTLKLILLSKKELDNFSIKMIKGEWAEYMYGNIN
jgi:hypothetical protein